MNSLFVCVQFAAVTGKEFDSDLHLPDSAPPTFPVTGTHRWEATPPAG